MLESKAMSDMTAEVGHPRAVVGLALGGGGALGAAHVGVLKALREHHVLPKVVAGTSAGSLVGAAFAAGLSIAKIEEAVLDADWSTFGRLRPTARLGLLDSAALLDTIDRLGASRRSQPICGPVGPSSSTEADWVQPSVRASPSPACSPRS